MKKKYADIINEGKAAGKTVDEINKELAAAGADFHLNPDGGVSGWSDAEMKEGFMPGEPAKEVQRGPDMSRRMDLAGTEQTQTTAAGIYKVTYDENGYAVKAVKV